MKSHAITFPWLAAAALALLSSPSFAGDKTGIVFELDRNGSPVARQPLEERRVPAFQRIEEGRTPYIYEGRVGVRHDEVSSNVMCLNIIATGGKSARLRAGHSLAPNFQRIVRP